MVKIGIAGVGAIARDYMTLIAQGRVQARLTALSSRNEENMRQALKTTGLEGVTLFTDYKAMLESGLIDAVLICTPHFQHPQMAIEALERGVHALVEKPLGVYAKEGKLLCDHAEKHPELVCGVLYCRRMNPAFREIKRLLDVGTVGRLKRANWIITNLYRTEAYHQSSPWRGKYASEGGGVLMNQAAHQLDLYLWLCGVMPERMQSFCYTGMERSIEVENDAIIHMEFPEGATGQFIASSREFPGTNRLELIGDLGQIVLENDTHMRVTRLKIAENEFARTSDSMFGPVPHVVSEQVFAPADNFEQQAALINDFLNAVQSGDKPACTPAQALRSLTVINASYLSAWQGKMIELPLDYDLFAHELQKRF